MNRCTSMLLITALLCAAPWAGADDVPAAAQPQKQASAGESFLLAEGLAVLNSGLATASPRGVSALIFLTAPLGYAESGRYTSTERWVGLGGYLAIGAMDASYPQDYSRPRVFAQNFLAWNLFFGALYLASPGGSARHLGLTPLPRHDGMMLSYRWTF